MQYYIAVLLLLVKLTASQDANCDYSVNVQAGQTYYVYSTNYPNSYPAGIQCRWVGYCPRGYNCQLNCPDIDMPYTNGCTADRLLVSRSGDLQLSGADVYCGKGTLSVTSIGTTISVGHVVPRNSPGGRFSCRLTAQPASPTPPSNCRCGYKKSNRIVGGQETQVNEFPMMAGLADRRIFQIKCGAVIISPFYLLSAAHCAVGQKTSDYTVIVGEHNVTTGDSPATRAYQISKFIPHPFYSESNNDYDILIVQTSSEIQFSDLVGPVCLPFKYVNTDLTGKYLTALGWGTQFPGGPTSDVLRKVDLQVISQSTCQRSISSLTSRQICTYTPGKDSCQDDSGGPQLYTDPGTGALMHIGIISFGRFCASREPSVNTRVTTLLDWITSNAPYDYCVK